MKARATLLIVSLLLAPAVLAGNASKRAFTCSESHLIGKWVFATEIGNFTGFGPITALGTLKVERGGALNGKFDATVGDAVFLPDNTYTGSIDVGRDCRGTLTFTDSTGASRTDSIVVVNYDEFWGMSQNPGVLWTYRAKRIGSM
jgi:hypothetical protein